MGCGIQGVIARRTRRIGLAARSLFLRQGLLASTVISAFSWMGSWVTVAHTTAQGWARSLESAVSGNLVSARSRFLLWAVWGRPHLRPKFALAWAAIAHELRRVARNLSTPCCPQLESAMQVLGWTRAAAGVFVTPGEVLPGFVSLTTAKAAAEDSWLRQLWAQDLCAFLWPSRGVRPGSGAAVAIVAASSAQQLTIHVPLNACAGLSTRALAGKLCPHALMSLSHAQFSPISAWLGVRKLSNVC